ncbi:hypothetical protein B0H14DRAFT_2591521 [Mycena olivaceomarginata]|nr:hypothetical protein B0H14DRAFT_2591521 [Mycena olivaceomarginata]
MARAPPRYNVARDSREKEREGNKINSNHAPQPSRHLMRDEAGTVVQAKLEAACAAGPGVDVRDSEEGDQAGGHSTRAHTCTSTSIRRSGLGGEVRPDGGGDRVQNGLVGAQERRRHIRLCPDHRRAYVQTVGWTWVNPRVLDTQPVPVPVISIPCTGRVQNSYGFTRGSTATRRFGRVFNLHRPVAQEKPTTRLDRVYGSLGPSYVRLAHFIKAVVTNGGHTRTIFGPNANFFSISLLGFCWQNLPPGLEDNIQSFNKLRQPVYVALGVEGTYIVMYGDDTMVFELCGQYPLLQTVIMEKAPKKRGLMYCALNLFVTSKYYAVYSDGGLTWCLHSMWSADVKTVSLQFKELLVYVPPATPVYAALPFTPIYMTLPPSVVVQAAPANGSGHKMNWQEGVVLSLKATSIIMGMPIWPLFGN